MLDVKTILAWMTIALCASAADLRVGVIGTDTSHVPAFAKLLNGDPNAPDHIAGANQPLPREEADRELLVRARRPHGDRQRLAVDPDLERLLHRELVALAIARAVAGHALDPGLPHASVEGPLH